MEYYLLWTVAIVVLVITEALTWNLVTIWFAFGALAALFASMAHQSFMVQLIVFALVSALLLAVTRPFVRNKLHLRDEKTNADRVVGLRGVVREDITPDKFAGSVEVSGQMWSAVSEDGNAILEGATVEVVRIEGVKLIVRKTASN